MAQPRVPILACRHETAVLFRVIGRATADHCPAMRRFAEAALADGAATIQVDLRDCAHFDSTFLGTLLLLRRACPGGPDAFTLASPSPHCRKIFDDLGAATFFRVFENEAPHDGAWEEMRSALEQGGPRPFQENIVASHRELARMPGPIGERYRPIAEQIAGELESAKTEGTSSEG